MAKNKTQETDASVESYLAAMPRSAETIYRSFNFKQPWEEVRHEDVWVHPRQGEDLRVLAQLDENGKVKPLFPRIA